MSSNEFVVTIPMPFTGESIVDGILVNWLVEPGERVEKGQNIAEIETEKSVWDFEAPCEGEIVALKAAPGDVVEVKAPLLEMRTDDKDVFHLLQGDGGGEEEETVPAAPETEITVSGNGKGKRLEVSPRVRRMLRDAEISDEEALKIPVADESGRLSAADVEAYLETAEKPAETRQKGEVTTYITGIGGYVPKRSVDNSVFTPNFTDISEEYIEKVTGIKERRWVDDETTSDMAYAAARQALDNSGMKADELDMIILATTTADMPLPASACMVQQKLGCRDIPAFDLQAACSGWLYALSIARQFLRNGAAKNILVVAAEAMSKFTDPSDRSTAFLFGDGAGAAVLSSVHTGHVLTDIMLTADSTGYDIIYRKAGGAIMPPRFMESKKDEYWYMDGGRMFRSAVAAFSHVITTVAEKAQTTLDDIKWFVPHQANERILKTVASRIKAKPERFFFNIKYLGNTSAASIPLALTDMEKESKIQPGDKVLLCAVGAGLTSAGCLIHW